MTEGTPRKPRIAVFTGSDLRNYGGGEKDVIGWASILADKLDIILYSPSGIGTERVSKEFIEKQLAGVKIQWYRGKKIRLLKDILPLQRFNVSDYDKVYSMCQGFLLNSVLIRHSKRFLLGIHAQSTLDNKPIEPKMWKRIFYKFFYLLQRRCIRKCDEIRIQNNDDAARLKHMNFKGRVWNVPPRMFASTPEVAAPDKFIVIWVNRLQAEKRPDELLDIAWLCPGIEFHLIGSGNYKFTHKQPDNVRLMGFLTDEQLSAEYQGASAYISTSRGENFGMSAVEAMAYGVPTIVYDVMGLRDYNLFVVKDAQEAAVKVTALNRQYTLDRPGYQDARFELRGKTVTRFSDDAVLPQILEMMTK